MKRAAYWLLAMLPPTLAGTSHTLANGDIDSLALFEYRTGSAALIL